MFTKVVAGVLAASVLIATLRLLGVTPSLQSPMLLAYLSGVLAVAASVIALFGEDSSRRDERGAGARISASPAARRPRSPNM